MGHRRARRFDSYSLALIEAEHIDWRPKPADDVVVDIGHDLYFVGDAFRATAPPAPARSRRCKEQLEILDLVQ